MFQSVIDECCFDGELPGKINDGVYRFAFTAQVLVAVLFDKSQFICPFGQTHIGIILTEQDAIFGT